MPVGKETSCCAIEAVKPSTTVPNQSVPERSSRMAETLLYERL